MATPALDSRLQEDRARVDSELRALLHEQGTNHGSVVHEAMCYAVLGEAQRIRPLLALATARLLQTDCRSVWRAALSVELLHCASLIVDDLPCMDNEMVRRGRATAHVQFGEATAVLAAFGLVSLAGRAAVDEHASERELRCQINFQRQLMGVLDCNSLIGGQSMDLHLSGELRELERDRMAELKTVPLFQLAVSAGSLYARCTESERECLRRFGREFGAAFQMMDDYLDDEAISMLPLSDQLDNARRCLTPFGSASRELEGLLDYLHARAWQKHHCHR